MGKSLYFCMPVWLVGWLIIFCVAFWMKEQREERMNFEFIEQMEFWIETRSCACKEESEMGGWMNGKENG